MDTVSKEPMAELRGYWMRFVIVVNVAIPRPINVGDNGKLRATDPVRFTDKTRQGIGRIADRVLI